MNVWLNISNNFAFLMVLLSVSDVLIGKLREGLLYSHLVQFMFVCYLISLFILNPLSEYKQRQAERVIRENKIDVIE